MSRFEYDEEASERLHMDVAYEIDERSGSLFNWVEAMRGWNAIDDPLARKILALHRDCGSGTGECDSIDHESGERQGWGCETTALIAAHFAVESH